jgi:hypothetical protein
MTQTARAGEPEPLIATPEAARALLAELDAAMAALTAVVEEETRLVKSGALMAASDLGPEKANCAATYIRLRDRVSRNRVGLATFAPAEVDVTRGHHEAFASLLKINLAVLATARDVAEDIVRNVSEAVGKTSAPATYGRGAAQRPAAVVSARGIALDRNL